MNREQMVAGEEGREHKAYPDPLSPAGRARAAGRNDLGLDGAPWTIGIGHTGPEVHQGLVWSDAQIDAAFAIDGAHADAECRVAFPWYARLDPVRQAVVWSMCFQMGINRLRLFKKALAAMRDGRWATAAAEMWDSAWAKQTPDRARRAARQMETGEWQ